MDLIKTLASLPESQPDTIPALFAAIVTRIDDPLGLRRIKVLIPNRDGSAESDWMQCVAPSPGINFDLPKPDRDIVICAYLDGEVNQGVWLGVLFTQASPPPFKERAETIAIDIEGDLRIESGHEIRLKAIQDILITSHVAEASLRLEALNADLVLRLGNTEVSVRDLVGL